MNPKTTYQLKNITKKGLNNEEDFIKLEKNKLFSIYQMAEFGKISFGIFHDLANILTSLTLNLEQIKTKETEQKENLEEALKISNKLNYFLNNIKKQLSGKREKTIFNINNLIDDCLQILNYKLQKNYIKYIFNKKQDIYIKGYYFDLGRIIFNIISNSIDAYDNFEQKNKQILIKVNEIKDNNKQKITIEIIDNGKGIKQKNLNKIFKLFFSTKKQKGLGIGLFECKNILKKIFNGDIEIKSKPNRGTKIKLIIPKNNPFL
ncbi:HAMP domain-containing histidine kinase [bacterium]|nr:HAMP domain-containing histidine kinase [bacterium]